MGGVGGLFRNVHVQRNILAVTNQSTLFTLEFTV